MKSTPHIVRRGIYSAVACIIISFLVFWLTGTSPGHAAVIAFVLGALAAIFGVWSDLLVRRRQASRH